MHATSRLVGTNTGGDSAAPFPRLSARYSPLFSVTIRGTITRKIRNILREHQRRGFQPVPIVEDQQYRLCWQIDSAPVRLIVDLMHTGTSMCLKQQNKESRCVAAARPAELILLWLGWADKDYVAARRLLLNAYLPQGAAMANTALEKYFKTLLMFVGKEIPRSHDIVFLRESILASFPNLKDVDGNFLKVLGKAYRLRYPDNLTWSGTRRNRSTSRRCMESGTSSFRVES